MRFRPSLRATSRVGAAVASSVLLATVAAPASAMASSPTTSATTVLTLTSTKVVGLPTTVAPGYHTFVLKESSKQLAKDPRGLTVLQLAKGYTRNQLRSDMMATFAPKYTAAVKKAYARLLKNTQALGGVELESDFTTTAATFTVLLKPGTYVLDNGASEEGAPDSLSIMKVAGTAVGSKPKTVGTVTSKEFHFKIVGAKAKKHEYALTNTGTQIHMYVMLRLDKGHSEAELFQALESGDQNGPPPAWVHNGGFAGVLTGGQTMWTTLNFSPNSNYELLCFMPDLKTGAPHFILGMHRFFSVK